MVVKHIVIFGSTGVTGLCVVETALRKGLRTKAFVRDPNKLPEPLKSQVEIIQGDVLDYDSVLKGVKDTDGIVVTLGTRNDLSATTVLSEGLHNIVTAMKEANVQIISVCLSAFLFFSIDSDSVPERLKEITRDHKRMYKILKETDLKHIAVFAPHIAPDAATSYIVKCNQYLGRRVSKFDLAQFLVDSLDKEEYYQKVVGIVSKH